MKNYIKPEISIEPILCETFLGGLGGGSVNTPGISGSETSGNTGNTNSSGIWDDGEIEE